MEFLCVQIDNEPRSKGILPKTQYILNNLLKHTKREQLDKKQDPWSRYLDPTHSFSIKRDGTSEKGTITQEVKIKKESKELI